MADYDPSDHCHDNLAETQNVSVNEDLCHYMAFRRGQRNALIEQLEQEKQR